jgi:hypothetical protein
MWKAIRRYGFSVFGILFVFVSAFFVNWGELWFVALWVLCSSLVCSNLINVVRVVDANETAERYYDKFIEYRRAYSELTIAVKKRGYQPIPNQAIPRETD